MASGIDSKIAELLFIHARDMSLPQTTAIAYADTTFEPSAGEPYIRADYLPNQTLTNAVGSGSFKHQGLFQLSVMWPSGGGVIDPLETASVIQSSFDKGTTLEDGTVTVRVTKRPSISGPIIDEDRTMFPVTVEYESFNT